MLPLTKFLPTYRLTSHKVPSIFLPSLPFPLSFFSSLLPAPHLFSITLVWLFFFFFFFFFDSQRHPSSHLKVHYLPGYKRLPIFILGSNISSSLPSSPLILWVPSTSFNTCSEGGKKRKKEEEEEEESTAVDHFFLSSRPSATGSY